MSKPKKNKVSEVGYHCPGCGNILATMNTTLQRVDWSFTENLVVVPPAQLEERPDEAPRLKCRCGKVVIPMQGSV